MTKLIYPNLSYKIVGICMEAHRNLGSKMQEKHYSREVENILKRENIKYKREQSINIETENGPIGKFFIDFVIDDKIVLELKTIPRIELDHKKQVLRYLKSSKYKLGILVNFRSKSLQPIRIVNADMPFQGREDEHLNKFANSIGGNSRRNRFPVVVILDNIRSALNVGAIFRTCDATNIEKLMLCGITAYPPHNRIPKTALGSTESVPWEHYKTTDDAIKTIQLSYYVTISMELTNEATNLWDYQFKPNTALVFGNEISGVSKEVLKMSDDVVKIPMFGKKKSLNVATSCGIVLYEVLRQLKDLN